MTENNKNATFSASDVQEIIEKTQKSLDAIAPRLGEKISQELMGRLPQKLREVMTPLIAQNLSLMNDIRIEELSQGERPMISPFVMGKVRKDSDGNKLAGSYGCSEFGYDLRLGGKVATVKEGYIMDPLNYDPDMWEHHEIEDSFVVQPKTGVLVHVMERLNMPENVLGIVADKSTWSRNFLFLPTPIAEPAWDGHLTLAMANVGSNPVRIYKGHGIAQILFFEGVAPKETYGEGKYQNQAEEVRAGTA